MPVVADVVEKRGTPWAVNLLGREREGGYAGPGSEITVTALVRIRFCFDVFGVLLASAVLIFISLAEDDAITDGGIEEHDAYVAKFSASAQP